MKGFSKILSILIYSLSTALGFIALVYPFFFPAMVENIPMGLARMGEMPLMLTVLLGLCLVVLLYEAQGQTINTKIIALLGVLVAINAALRFIEVAIPGPGGFSPIFFLIILTGYIFGGKFGFLIGSLTIFVSALVTGGVGPWLPSQMFAAGWAGMSASLCRPLVRGLRLKNKRGEIIILAIFGALWGILYGFIMNLWAWPFIAGPAEQYWAPGTGFAETLNRYLAYYVVTSLGWDILRAVGNAVLILGFGSPTLRALRRFQRRFDFDYLPANPTQISTELDT
ncbi:MAG: ECF transporter S component [Anaerolineales bacterium]|nr:ECF transporter S component [Anaerolineales bacterium]